MTLVSERAKFKNISHARRKYTKMG